ncbi:MAG: hypothetical protein KDB61_04825 [Planctomycetes bacterium]|nr:hypothetical protein [Planctomycetota bacterium]
MTRAQAWCMHGACLLVGGSGLIYGYMRYFATPDDPFSVVNHPLQPTLQHLHILAAPLLVFACGWIWEGHVWKRIRQGNPTRRRSGWTMVLTLAPMVVSGYAVQVSVDESWRTLWIWIHGVSSCLWLLFALIHPWLPHAIIKKK